MRLKKNLVRKPDTSPIGHARLFFACVNVCVINVTKSKFFIAQGGIVKCLCVTRRVKYVSALSSPVYVLVIVLPGRKIIN